MPSVSERQRRFLFMKFGEAWVRKHHFDRVVKHKMDKKKAAMKGR